MTASNKSQNMSKNRRTKVQMSTTRMNTSEDKWATENNPAGNYMFKVNITNTRTMFLLLTFGNLSLHFYLVNKGENKYNATENEINVKMKI